MNILPKKSWHVRNKNNIERVRKDEAKAAEEEKERQRKIAVAESEARTDLLRDKARKRKHGDEEIEEPDEEKPYPRHINFFQELEDGKKLGGKNADYEKEKQEGKEKQEKAIGLLTHLGQGSIELEGKAPWYLNKSLREKTKLKKETAKDERKKDEIDTKHKRSLDPMLSVVRYVEQTEKVHRIKEGSSSTDSYKSHKKKESSSRSFGPQTGKTMEQLRAERLKREQMERMRQNQLLSKAGGEKESRDTMVDERLLPYNSQFNPDLVALHKMRTSNRDSGTRF